MTDESKMDVDDTKPSTTTTEKKSNNENVTPSASGEDAAKYPDMKLAQSIHQLLMMRSKNLPENKADDTLEMTTKKVFEKVITEMENPSLYKTLQSSLGSSSSHYNGVTDESLEQMMKKNEETLKELEEKVEKAKEEAGDMEVLDARFDIAKFAAKSLSKEEALEAYGKVLALPKLSSGKIMDALMESSRLASFYDDLLKNGEFVQKVSIFC